MNAREWEAHKAMALKAGRDNARSRGGRPLKLGGKEELPALTVVGDA
jgi:hypothetical protein